nr:unnamed protein product [Fasciola hepatica]
MIVTSSTPDSAEIEEGSCALATNMLLEAPTSTNIFPSYGDEDDNDDVGEVDADDGAAFATSAAIDDDE